MSVPVKVFTAIFQMNFQPNFQIQPLKQTYLSFAQRVSFYLLVFFVTAFASNVVAYSGPGGLNKKGSTFTFMSYNVQNLFDTIESPDTNDHEFTPGGLQKWTEVVLSDKIQNLGEVIRSSNPAIIALTEVENQAVVEQLVNQGLSGMGYITAVSGPSDDSRGIRNAVVSKFPVKSTRSHRVWRDTWRNANGGVQKTRDILEVTLVAAIQNNREVLVTVLVSHWPSKSGGVAREFMRVDAAETMKKITQDILREDPDRLIVSAGDFNDELYERSFREGLTLVNTLKELLDAAKGAYYAVSGVSSSWAPEDRGTYYFHPEKKWNVLDHILISASPRLLNGSVAGFHYVADSFVRVSPEKYRHPSLKFPQGCEINPRRNIYEGRRGARCPFGASDHFPIVADFQLK